MNNSGQVTLGFALILVLAIVLISLAAFIDPFKETLDNIRGTSSLNCPGTPTFNATDYANDDTDQKLLRRPVCFVTGLSMVYFIGSVIIAWAVWLYTGWFGK